MIAGVGIGMGIQQTLVCVQTVLDLPLVPTGTAVIVFMHTVGGALFVSVVENFKCKPHIELISSLLIGQYLITNL